MLPAVIRHVARWQYTAQPRSAANCTVTPLPAFSPGATPSRSLPTLST